MEREKCKERITLSLPDPNKKTQTHDQDITKQSKRHGQIHADKRTLPLTVCACIRIETRDVKAKMRRGEEKKNRVRKKVRKKKREKGREKAEHHTALS
mmetsp:Transcript_29863/g.58580  ORF Transcript_29863/g.58580 Transcript_29863/m.58580 type:complete len:98 (-) Transcript_29863:72-365(-)